MPLKVVLAEVVLVALILGELNCPPQADLLYEASRLVVEESILEGREHTAGRVEAGDVVVGILHAVAGDGQGSGGHDDYLEQLRR
jgi:hypothetical protein